MFTRDDSEDNAPKCTTVLGCLVADNLAVLVGRSLALSDLAVFIDDDIKVLHAQFRLLSTCDPRQGNSLSQFPANANRIAGFQ